jgi:hypothetical protein
MRNPAREPEAGEMQMNQSIANTGTMDSLK